MKRGFRRWIIVFFIANVVFAQNPAPEAGKLILDPAIKYHALLTYTPAQFMEQFNRFGFRWNAQDQQDTARSANPSLSFVEHRVWEALVHFKDGRFCSFDLLLYNRGDAGNLAAAEYNALRKKVEQDITQWAGVKGIPLKPENRGTLAVIERTAWVTDPYRVDLECSYTRAHSGSNNRFEIPFRAEYIKVSLSPYDPSTRAQLLPNASGYTLLQQQTRHLTLIDLKKRVQHEENGNVFIGDIPMVDQGRKGYCIPAASERLLRYYGIDFDQHELAQLAGTGTGGGTSVEEMLTALRAIATKYELSVIPLFTLVKDINTLEQVLNDYNRMARAFKIAPVSIAGMRTVDLDEIYRRMDAKVFKESRIRKKAELSAFLGDIKKYIDNGVPLLWVVEVGWVKETPPLTIPPPVPPLLSNVFGHGRLIIGYNLKQSTILYSDTWGAGHESKCMALEDAWFITQGLYTTFPRAIQVR